MKLQIYDPSRQQFVYVDAGQLGSEALLLNILIELRVHSVFLQALVNNQVMGELSDLRNDVVNDPTSFVSTTL